MSNVITVLNVLRNNGNTTKSITDESDDRSKRPTLDRVSFRSGSLSPLEATVWILTRCNLDVKLSLTTNTWEGSTSLDWRQTTRGRNSLIEETECVTQLAEYEWLHFLFFFLPFLFHFSFQIFLLTLSSFLFLLFPIPSSTPLYLFYVFLSFPLSLFFPFFPPIFPFHFYTFIFP